MESEAFMQNETMRKVEELIKDANSKFSSNYHDDITKVLSELQSYQAELEIQNENLKASQEMLEKSKYRYTSLYYNAPVGYVSLDKSGIIQDCNVKALDFLGSTKEYIVGKPFVVYVSPESHDEFYNHLNRVYLQTSTIYFIHINRCPMSMGQTIKYPLTRSTITAVPATT